MVSPNMHPRQTRSELQIARFVQPSAQRRQLFRIDWLVKLDSHSKPGAYVHYSPAALKRFFAAA